MTPIDTIDHSRIIQEVADAYNDWRQMYGAPRTQSETLQMVENILDPLLGRLTAWDSYNKTSAATLNDIKNLIANAEAK